ncbi:hypothetical protein TSUD_08720 [Trifolium subterraneum]|nr:hypothetical protein TSUD_08720 [Trifolium subterraneum]
MNIQDHSSSYNGNKSDWNFSLFFSVFILIIGFCEGLAGCIANTKLHSLYKMFLIKPHHNIL